MQSTEQYCDVVILGAGLAGLTLSRQLLMGSEKSILVLDKSAVLPTPKQKYGESTVQVGGYYLSKVLDLEEYLWYEHFMKYNLRFYFKSPQRSNDRFEDYGQAYIRNFSNIGCYQLDRNRFESDLLAMNRSNDRFRIVAPAERIQVDLCKSGLHEIRYWDHEHQTVIKSAWIVDTTGRGRHLARQMDIHEETPINHGASFMWVNGTVNIEKLTDSSRDSARLNRARSSTGHLPHWLATNHFMGEGFWFWVIPLRNMTSLGLVYDKDIIDGRSLTSAENLRDWVCREFPMFARDLPQREIVDFNALKNYSFGCEQTISSSKWAMSGESGRFTDPLYSPGSDFIAIHNSLIVDAILCDDQRKLNRKCWLAESMMQACYQSLLPSFVTTYDALGDQETFVLKYTWELSIYFAFFVFPFINDLTTDGDFIPGYLRRFSRMGHLNRSVQAMISGYYQWKKSKGCVGNDLVYHDFMSLEPLRTSERTFYEVGVESGEGKRILDHQLANLSEFARFIVAHISSIVLSDERIVCNRAFVESIDFRTLVFDVDAMRRIWEDCSPNPEEFEWSFDFDVLDSFRVNKVRDMSAEA